MADCKEDISTALRPDISIVVQQSLGVAWASVLAVRLAWCIQVMIWLVWPVAWLCTLIIRRLTRRARGSAPSEEEIIVMADLAAQRGTILPAESRCVANILRLDDITARDLMTPREVVQSLPADLPLGKIEPNARQWVHSRIPLTEGGDLDRVVGIVQRRAVFDELVQDHHEKRLRDLARPALFVPETLSGHHLLERLIEQRQHVAIVTDEARRTSGLVSFEDVLEYLLGRPIIGEHDEHPEMERMARERSRFHASHHRNEADYETRSE